MNVKPKCSVCRLNLAIFVLVVVGAVIVIGTAKAATIPCQGTGVNAIMFNAEWGLKPYLVGIGSSWWEGKGRLQATTVLPAPTVCDSPQIKQAYADQLRFYTLLRAFPQAPTRAQWNARFVPLIQLSIKLDGEFLPLSHGNSIMTKAVEYDLAWLRKVARTPYDQPAE